MTNELYDKQILDICQNNKRRYPQVLRSKQFKHLWDYILSCTKVLQEKEVETGHKYRVSTFVNWTLNHRTEFGSCKTCGKLFDNVDLSFDGDYQKHCCTACTNKDPNHIKAVSDTLEQRYGKRFPAQIPQFFQKMGDTCEKLYGVRNGWNLQKVKDKSRSPDAIARRLDTLRQHNQEQYGVDWFVQSDKFKEMTKTTNGTSREERQLVQWLKSFVDENDILVGTFKIIKPLQLDVFIMSKKVAIEFNGTYYHSIERNCDINYHLMKTKMCEEVGIHLIHIWENEWNEHQDLVKKFVREVVDGTLDFDSHAVCRDGGLLEVDRSKLNKCAIPRQYQVVEETPPEIVIRSKSLKDKYRVPDCGKLILKRIS